MQNISYIYSWKVLMNPFVSHYYIELILLYKDLFISDEVYW